MTKGSRRKRRKAFAAPFLLAAAVILIAVAAGANKVQRPPTTYVEEIAPVCRAWGGELPLVLAVIQAESGFREGAVSRKGAVGPMQVMPDTARWLADICGLEGYADDKLADKEWNLIIGISYLDYLGQQFPGSLVQVLAAYNAGPNRVRSWLDAGDWDGSIELLEDIPYPETKNYVKKVLKAYNNYKKYYT